jgi:hypothetical protein
MILNTQGRASVHCRGNSPTKISEYWIAESYIHKGDECAKGWETSNGVHMDGIEPELGTHAALTVSKHPQTPRFVMTREATVISTAECS